MTKDEILSMASQAGIVALGDVHIELEELERFAALVAEKEREACAKVCDVPCDVDDWEVRGGSDGRELCNDLAAKIRARGNK
jgi:hypothetical protein